MKELLTAVTIEDPPNLQNISELNRQEALDTALYHAITSKAPVENIIHLLRLGANPDGRKEKGSLLACAYELDSLDVLEALLAAGANVNAPYCDIVEQAVKKGDEKYLLRIVEAGADINGQRLVLDDDLLNTAEGFPKIQKYLLSKGVSTGHLHPELIEELKDVHVLQPEDFEFTTTSTAEPITRLQQYSKKYLVVRDEPTSVYRDAFKELGGRYRPKLRKGGKGWLFPNSVRGKLEELLELGSSLGENSPDLSKFAAEQKILERPTINKEQVIAVGPSFKNQYLCTNYSRPGLFTLDGYLWDSVERYLMYKMYQGTPKGLAIKKAMDLCQARRIFELNDLAEATSPKEQAARQRLLPIANSQLNPLFNLEQAYYLATQAKFQQNNLLREYLKHTARKPIISVSTVDRFGYCGNLLGSTLIKLRAEMTGQTESDSPRTNNLTIAKYNNNFYIIRGNPDSDIAQDIRKLGTYKTKAGRKIRGKLARNLKGWLVPKRNRREAKQLVFETYPDDKKLAVCGKDWVKKKLKAFLEVAYLFARLRKKQEIGSDDVLFAIKDFFRCGEFLGIDNGQPDEEFRKLAIKYSKRHDITISDAAIKLLWDFLSKLSFEITTDVSEYSAFKARIAALDAAILEKHVESLSGLDQLETAFIKAFNRVYGILLSVVEKPTQACITTVGMLVGHKINKLVRDAYLDVSKKSGSDDDDPETYRDRFGIKNPHLEAILEHLLTGLPKKCKLLVLVALDQISRLDEKTSEKFKKRILVIY